MGQPEGRLTAENLRSSGRVLCSRQLPWEEWAGISVPKCQLEWRSSTVALPLSDETSASSLMLNFVWQMTPLHWGLDARLKNMNRTERDQFYKAVISAEVSVHISCCTLTPNLCMSEMQSKCSYSNSTR